MAVVHEQAKTTKVEVDRLRESLKKNFVDLMRWGEELQSANAKLI